MMHSRVERLIGHIGTETRPKLLREAAVGNLVGFCFDLLGVALRLDRAAWGGWCIHQVRIPAIAMKMLERCGHSPTVFIFVGSLVRWDYVE